MFNGVIRYMGVPEGWEGNPGSKMVGEPGGRGGTLKEGGQILNLRFLAK